jgi:hypothetical protein
MQHLTSEQRHDLYRQEAQRTGIHLPILAALYEIHGQPGLSDGETGLGVIPANQVGPEQINTFAGQVKYAANTLRSLTNGLIDQGWQGDDFWQSDKGGYSRPFLQQIANGGHLFEDPRGIDPRASRLEWCDLDRLQVLYRQHVMEELTAAGASANQSYLDQVLRSRVEQLPADYYGLSYQREAMLEMVRLWQGLDDRDGAIASLSRNPRLAGHLAPNYLTTDYLATGHLTLNVALLQFLQQALPNYGGYPHQRQALLQLVQQWYQLDSQAATLRSLQQGFAPTDHGAIDTALLAFIQTIPQIYQGKGRQRNALVEGFRLWQQLDTRPAALIALGVNPALFGQTTPSEAELEQATTQTDRAILDFVHHIPDLYIGNSHQRQALTHLAQLWFTHLEQAAPEKSPPEHGPPEKTISENSATNHDPSKKSASNNDLTSEKTIRALFDHLKQVEISRKDSPDQLPGPRSLEVPVVVAQWTPDNLQLFAPIIPNGRFTWADATRGGLYLPTNQGLVDGMIQMGEMAEIVRDRLGRPLTIVRWYTPGISATEIGTFATSRHALGMAIVFYCDGFTGRQLYWFLNPWWPGRLGYNSHYPYLCYIDVGRDRVRWFR